MESLLTGAEAWLSETGKLAATWLGDDPEETEAHVHMRHARQVAIALERGAEPPPAPTVAPRYAPRDGDASGAEQSGMSDADGLEGGAKSKRRWRERPPPGSPAARAECVPWVVQALRAASAHPQCQRAQRAHAATRHVATWRTAAPQPQRARAKCSAFALLWGCMARARRIARPC
jgi:hypothetical protein